MKILKPLLAAACLAALGAGCVHAISPEWRRAATAGLTVAQVRERAGSYEGRIVIWGGIIVETVNRRDGTTVVVLETPLDYYGRPAPGEATRGRFLAGSSRYLDPEVFRKGRKVTVAGEITGSETRPLGETDYDYPVLDIKQVYLWPMEEPRYFYPYGYPYWWGPYYPSFYFGWGLSIHGGD